MLRRRIADKWLVAGVTMIDPDTTYIDADVEIGRDTVIEPGCVIQGPTVIGERCHLKAYTTIESSRLEDDVSSRSTHVTRRSHASASSRTP